MHWCVLKSRIGKHSSILGLNYIRRLPNAFRYFKAAAPIVRSRVGFIRYYENEFGFYRFVFFIFGVG